MNAPKKNSLKDRLQALKVREPSVVAKTEAPRIEVPSVVQSQTQVPQNVQPQRITQVEHSGTEGYRNERTQSETTKVEHPRNENSHPSLVNERSSVLSAFQGAELGHQENRNEHSQNEDTKTRVTQIENASKEVPHYQLSEMVHAGSENSRNLVSQKESSRDERSESDVALNQNAEKEVSRTKATHREQPVPKKPMSEVPEKELTQNECDLAVEEIEGPPRGYFKLAHAVFWDADLRSLPGDCFRLFLWMSSQAWQYPDSDGTMRAAVRWIGAATGMANATVSRSLNILKEKELIKIARTDYHDGNIWKVSPKAFGNRSVEKPGVKIQIPQNENAQNGHAAFSKSESSAPEMSNQHSQIECKKRSSKEIIKTTTLPLDAPEKLKSYFEFCKPFRKRESELKSFGGLIKDYSMPVITDGLDFLLTRGLPTTHETCNYPMAYMSFEMPKVLGEIEKLQRVEGARRAEANAARKKALDDALAEKEMAVARAAFDAAIPDANKQESLLESFLASRFSSGFRPPKSVALDMFIREWHQSQVGQRPERTANV